MGNISNEQRENMDALAKAQAEVFRQIVKAGERMQECIDEGHRKAQVHQERRARSIVRLVNSGMTLAEIGRRLGVSATRVHQYMTAGRTAVSVNEAGAQTETSAEEIREAVSGEG